MNSNRRKIRNSRKKFKKKLMVQFRNENFQRNSSKMTKIQLKKNSVTMLKSNLSHSLMHKNNLRHRKLVSENKGKQNTESFYGTKCPRLNDVKRRKVKNENLSVKYLKKMMARMLKGRKVREEANRVVAPVQFSES